MALADFVYRLKPEAGDATPHDEKGAGANLTGGTISLVDATSGGKAWKFESGQASAAIPSKTVDGVTVGGGLTIAITLQVDNYGTTDFTFFAGIGTDALSSATTSNGIHIGRTSANILRARYTTAATATIGTVNTAERTHVLRFRTNYSGSNDILDTWIDTVGRSGVAPNASSSAIAASSLTYDTLSVNAVNGAILRVKDFVVWHEELSDTDCAALADTGIRTTLDGGSGVTGTASWTEENDTAAASGSLEVTGTSTSTEANDTAAGTGTVGDVVSGTGAWTEANDTASASGTLTVSGTSVTTEANDTASASGSVTGGNPTLTTRVLKNNTGTPLVNQSGVTLNIYNATTGALVLRVTGLTTTSEGRVVVSDAALSAATSYAYEPDLTSVSLGRRLPVATTT